VPTDAHYHEWEMQGTELGDALARCACGQERLMTGTVVRYRRSPRDRWETPYSWNKDFYGRKEPQNEG
jgi:hypothetical protein